MPCEGQTKNFGEKGGERREVPCWGADGSSRFKPKNGKVGGWGKGKRAPILVKTRSLRFKTDRGTLPVVLFSRRMGQMREINNNGGGTMEGEGLIENPSSSKLHSTGKYKKEIPSLNNEGGGQRKKKRANPQKKKKPKKQKKKKRNKPLFWVL